MSVTVGELTVSGYIRHLQRELNMIIVEDIWSIIIMFYPNCIEFNGNTMNLTMHEKEQITSWFVDLFEIKSVSRSLLTADLLYTHGRDGIDAQDWHSKCEGNDNLFTIVQPNVDGHIFGCFLSKKLTTSQFGVYLTDKKAFLCVIRSCFKDKGPEIFKADGGAMAYFGFKDCGPCFGSADLALYYFSGDNNYVNHIHSNYDSKLQGNTLCGGDQYRSTNIKYTFEIKEMNTYTIKLNEA